ncbi:putative cytochrome P450 [Exophiala viscosa]|uniref:Cytochrome P450 n=1 Tax=Exophiala viscosa TaxID=2486360 RepID=A0AAN6I8W0_9EURO|nr:putative cytochrome P450 [Exophiala viscosa]
MIEYLFTPYILVGVLLAAAITVYNRLRPNPALPDLPWLNTREGELFTRLRAGFRSTLNYKQTVHQAYEQDQSCIIPDINGAEIVLPISSVQWLINQPDSILSSEESHRISLQTDYTFVHPFVVANPLHHETVRNELTRQLSVVTPDIVDELSVALDEIWGIDTVNWREVCVFDTAMEMIARISNRVFVGLPLCRDAALLGHGKGFATAMAVSAAVLKQSPAILRPLVAPIVTLSNKRHTKGYARIVRPEIERRQRLLNDINVDKEKGIIETEPNDFMQWTIRRARESGIPVENDADIIAERILAVNFAAIHTSTFSVTNAVFDLLASDPSLRYVDQLRDEAASVLAQNGGSWTKQGVAKMIKIDSALRESSRIGSFLGLGLTRIVMGPTGVTAPNGTFCPYRSTISVPTNGLHNDPMQYPNALSYQPLRFSLQRKNQSRGDGSDDQSAIAEDYIKQANLSFVSTSPTYHAFGHGRHACPGRFFAANELKLLLAHMLLKYEFEMLPSRPESKWLGTALVPPMKATIKIRRRVD